MLKVIGRMEEVSKKPKKSKMWNRTSRLANSLRKPHILIFAVAFALIGGYVILRSFAFVPPPPKISLEKGINLDPCMSSAKLYTTDERNDAAKKMQAGGAKWARMNVAWQAVEGVAPTKGQNHFNLETGQGKLYADCLDLIHAHGMKALVVLYGVPSWAHQGVTDPLEPPTDPSSIKPFVEYITGFIKTKVGNDFAIEVWNEPDGGPGPWKGDKSQYVDYFNAVYASVKKVAPNVTVMTGGVTPKGTGWINSVLKDKKLTPPDAVGFHPYPDGCEPPDKAFANVSKIETTKPIWFTEFGWSRDKCASQQAQLLTDSYTYAKAHLPNVPVMLWFTSGPYRDCGAAGSWLCGLTLFDDSSPAGYPAYTAYQKVTSDSGGNSDHVAPEVKITSPVAGNVSGTIDVKANASDNVGVTKVTFSLHINDVVIDLGTATSEPYTVSWNTNHQTNGSGYSLTATASDAAGNSKTDTVLVTINNVDTTPPTVTVSSPTQNSTVDGTVSITANATDNVGISGVTFSVDGQTVGTEDTTAPYSVSWNTSQVADDTVHHLTATARDSSSISTTSAPVDVIVQNDHNPPKVKSISRANNKYTNAASVAYSVVFSKSVTGVDKDDFALAATAVSAASITSVSGSGNSYTVVADTGHGDGTLALNLVDNDTIKDANGAVLGGTGKGNGSFSGEAYVIDRTKPTLTIGKPSKSLVNSGPVEYKLTYDDLNFDTTNLNAAKLSLTKTGTATAKVQTGGGTAGKIHIVNLPTISGDGTLKLSVSDATATDKAGNTADAAGPSDAFTIDSTPPAVSITTPAANAVVKGATLAVSINASDANGLKGVEVKAVRNNGVASDSISICKMTAAPFNCSWNISQVADGNFTMTASATDKADNKQNSAPVSFSIKNASSPDTIPPSVPQNLHGADVTNTKIKLQWSTSQDNPGGSGGTGVAGYKVFKDGQQIAVTVDSQYTDTDVHAGKSYNYQVSAFDGATPPNESAKSATVKITADNNKPRVDLLAPRNHAFLKGTTQVSIRVRDEDATTTKIKLDDHEVTPQSGGGSYDEIGLLYWYDVDTTKFSNAPHILSVEVTDPYNATTTVSSNITIDNLAPTAKMTAPTAASTVSGAITVAASATDNIGVTGVQFMVDNTNLKNLDTTAPYSVNVDTTALSAGQHCFSAKSLDAAGNSKTADPVCVTVNNTLPPVDKTKPSIPTDLKASSIAQTAVTLVWGASTDNKGGSGIAGYRLYRDGKLVGSTDKLTLGDKDLQSRKTYSYRVTAYDNAGNESDKSKEVRVFTDDQSPTAEFVLPGAGSTLIGKVTVQVEASDDVAVAKVHFEADGKSLGDVTAAPYKLDWDTTKVRDGNYRLDAMVSDNNGHTTKVSEQVTVSNTKPTIVIKRPKNNHNVSGEVRVLAKGDNISGSMVVQFLVDGKAIGPMVKDKPFQFSWDSTKISNGDHKLTAQVWSLDAPNRPIVDPPDIAPIAESAPITVHVNNKQVCNDKSPPSTPDGLSGVSLDLTEVVVFWHKSVDTGCAGMAGYKVYRDGQFVGSVQSTGYLDRRLHPNTTYKYKVTAIDKSGNESSPSKEITVRTDNTEVNGIETNE